MTCVILSRLSKHGENVSGNRHSIDEKEDKTILLVIFNFKDVQLHETCRQSIFLPSFSSRKRKAGFA